MKFIKTSPAPMKEPIPSRPLQSQSRIAGGERFLDLIPPMGWSLGRRRGVGGQYRERMRFGGAAFVHIGFDLLRH
ncbi:predicted protein [Arabidopsis lyrata subsp. lyrata]|uniref:Predicted protein n=1 Tax=Arabidopsis lyrata subsp. lyrata TaxID=81972 RepID=D7KSY4_ARALL|nr:predicted protein [Arabidopsis lyrata subsp. lyrata]